MKKLMILLLALMVAASAFAGGNQGSGGSSQTATRGARGTLPLTTSPVTFTVFAGTPGGASVSSFEYARNSFSKRVTDETGIKLEFITAMESDAQERLNVLMNTNSYPDIIMRRMGLDDLNYYASQGIVIPLDKYDPLSYPHIKAAFDEAPALKNVVTGPDGKMYALPSLNECLHCTFGNGRIWYYMPWFRDKNIKAPTTINDLTQFLRTIRDTDFNGNGKKDEIPLAFDKGNFRNFISFIAQAYMPWVGSGEYGVAVVNGQLTEQFRSNEFREALKYMASLYKEGLIYPDSFNMSSEQMQSLAQAEPNVLGVLGNSWKNGVTVQPSPRWIDFFSLAPLKGPTGQQWGANASPADNMSAQFIITNKCKDPDLAIALYDYLINYPDVAMHGYIGAKGVAWGNPDPGGLGLDGKPAIYKLITAYGSQPINGSWDQSVLPMIRFSRWFYIGNQSKDADKAAKFLETGDSSLRQSLLDNIDYAEVMWYLTAQQHQKYAKSDSLFIPPMAMSDADTARLSDINAVLNPYKDQVFAEFITGARDINNNAAWNTYLAELDRLNSKEVLSIRQKYLRK